MSAIILDLKQGKRQIVLDGDMDLGPKIGYAGVLENPMALNCQQLKLSKHGGCTTKLIPLTIRQTFLNYEMG